MAHPGYIGPPDTDKNMIGRVGGGSGGYELPNPGIGRAGGGTGPSLFGVPLTPPGADRLPGLQSLGNELARISQPGFSLNPNEMAGGIVNSVNSIPGAPQVPSPETLLGMAPGADQLPGVSGFTNMLGNMLGFGSNNPSWNDLFGEGGIISSQMRQAPEGYTNPFQNILAKYAGAAGRDPYRG